MIQNSNHPASGIRLIECPRDAMQGWKQFIPTEQKAAYINALLQTGFDTIDFGSFVSPKVIPQMADTKEVLKAIHWKGSPGKLLAIVANLRGAIEAVDYEAIRYLGFPFSISETFQLKNTNSTIAASLITLKEIQELCRERDKEMVAYLSMGFGNPYGDPYDTEIVMKWVEKIATIGIKTISLADTVGVASPAVITYLFSHLIPAFPGILFGAHFHSAPHNWEEKIDAAYNSGCLRFDSAIKGIGGCPMAAEELVGNIATENLASYFERKKIPLPLRKKEFAIAQAMAAGIFA